MPQATGTAAAGATGAAVVVALTGFSVGGASTGSFVLVASSRCSVGLGKTRFIAIGGKFGFSVS